jgi:hypothetical protein
MDCVDTKSEPFRDRIDAFHAFATERLLTKIDKNSVTIIVANDDAIVAKAKELDVADKAVIVLIEILLGGGSLYGLPAHRSLFNKFTSGNERAQRAFLNGLERLAESDPDKVYPKLQFLLKSAYELDIVEERAILRWWSKLPRESLARNKVDGFVNWLNEADTESSSSSLLSNDDDDDEIDIDAI